MSRLFRKGPLGPALAFFLAMHVVAQTTPSTDAKKPSETLSPALAQVKQSVAALNIQRWKVSGAAKASAQQNLDSIQRDLDSVLPSLLATADAAPTSVPAVFPVYRNVDALYDVLLRVWQTASLSAPQSEAGGLTTALSQLESARAEIGNTILTVSKNNETELGNLRAAAQRAAAATQAAPTAPAKTNVVNDGPAKTTAARRKKKPAPATPPPASTPAPQ